MTELLNLNGLLGETKGYLDALKVPEADANSLTRARELIRDTLRAAFRNPESHISKHEIFEIGAPIDPTTEILRAPKFRLQGSFKYGTANDCQINPPQEIDQDDGVFLPVSFFQGPKGDQPLIASKAYFTLVERALRPLADRQGWIVDDSKNTCVRVKLSRRLHLDLPLYVVPNTAYASLAKNDAKRRLINEEAFRHEVELTDGVYNALAQDTILLAHRIKGWDRSDPRTLEKWFANAVGLHGSILRRLSRGYKGMRDAHGMDNDLGSIAIMVGAVEAFSRVGKPPRDREDIAFRDVARELSRVFGSPVYNPAFPNDDTKRLCVDWSAETRKQICALFKNTADSLDVATTGTNDKRTALRRVRDAFGERVPDDPSLIKAVGEADRIRSQQAKPQPAPLVPRYKSG